jgi:class 3 adenylate cyclase
MAGRRGPIAARCAGTSSDAPGAAATCAAPTRRSGGGLRGVVVGGAKAQPEVGGATPRVGATTTGCRAAARSAQLRLGGLGPLRDSGRVGPPRGLPRGNVTFLFCDVEGSTALARAAPDAWPEVLNAYLTVLRGAVREHGGVEISTAGDGLLAAFAGAPEAVAAAADAQRALAKGPWAAGISLRARMGLHTGEPLLTNEGYVGLDLHRGARVMGAGHGGQVLLTRAVRQSVGDRLPRGVAVRDLGERRLKDFPEPEPL